MTPEPHKPFTDDGVTYCGWDGREGCGELWPCSTVRGMTFDTKPRTKAPSVSQLLAETTLESQKVRNAIERAIRIIEDADGRAAAVDGPVNHVRDEMTDREWRDLYRTLKGAFR